MLIKRLEVKGFKSLKDVVWEPGPLTILIGPNGSGKTNILKAIELISSSGKGSLEDVIQVFGGISSIFWDGACRDIHIDFDINIGEYDFHPTPTYATYQININNSLFSSTYTLNHEKYTTYNTYNNKFSTLINRNSIMATVTTEGKDKQIEINKQSIFNKETIVSRYNDRFDTDHEISALQYLLSTISTYNTILTTSNAKIRFPLITRHETDVHSDGQNLVNVLHTLYSENRDFENDINTAMRAAFGDDFDRLVFPPAADQLVQLRIRWKSLKREQSMLDLSDGTIRFLFLMTVLCNPEPPSLIAIDEPETGLHPSMFPIIAEYAAEASTRTQVVFSTHSPQFLDAFSDFNPTTTVTTWQDGETKIKNLDGEALKEWLKHYSLGTLFLSGDLEAMA
ncbi:AAA family ATPase [Solidesulfovibrio sp.]|uniref:AAA family ATPase n=1 Tax=Solidesulfovibrio sp. TaxID=2910990 RepID=UPI0026227903|nr:AAA family ATPase [Solidesulfovibrio sp.]